MVAADARTTVLIDSNIFIAAEDHGADGHVYGAAAAELLRLVQELGYELLISNGTRRDLVAADQQLREQRRRALEKYQVMARVPVNRAVRAQFPAELSDNNTADVEVLSSFATGRAQWLVTHDRPMRSRALAAGLRNVLSLTDAVEMFRALVGRPVSLTAPEASHVAAYEISTESPIFDSLRADYGTVDFNDWWVNKVVRPERPTIVLGEAEDPAGLAVLKNESDRPHGLPSPVMKICTFKIGDEHVGSKRGEALLRACLEHARAQGHARVYMEVLPSKTDLLIWLERFGFHAVEGATTTRGELVLIKQLEPPPGAEVLGPLEHQVAYGPGSLRLERAHMVPIVDRYHQLLFPDADDQDMLFVGTRGCGNAIRKAYLCRSPSRKVQPGDGLLFARTGTGTAKITTVGVVESVYVSTDPDELVSLVGTRTVYSREDIADMCSRGEVLALLFRHDRVLTTPISMDEVAHAGVFSRTPQSIAQLGEEGLGWVRPLLDV